ncbi:MAG: chorismate mutase [Chloroflexota bacterium]|jgi:chorismate mutase
MQSDRPTRCQGVRGAITVEANTAAAIRAATHELLRALVEANQIVTEDIGGAFFTTTVDLNAEYPAAAARELGWHDVAILCGHEMNVPGGMPMCLRVLVLWNTTRAPQEIQHVYLREAQALRPDRAVNTPA